MRTVKGSAKVVVEPELDEGNTVLEARYVEKTNKGKTRKEYLDRTIKVANYNEIVRKIVY